MTYTLTGLGILLSIAAVVLLIMPERGFEFGRKNFLSSGFQYAIGIVTLVLAMAIYYSSPDVKYPALFELVALLSLVGGSICLVIPPSIFRRVVSWELTTFSPYGRFLGICYGLIGGFLIYAAS